MEGAGAVGGGWGARWARGEPRGKGAMAKPGRTTGRDPDGDGTRGKPPPGHYGNTNAWELHKPLLHAVLTPHT